MKGGGETSELALPLFCPPPLGGEELTKANGMYGYMVDDLKAFPELRHLPSGHGDVAYGMHFTRDGDLIAKYRSLRKELYGIDPRFVGFRIFNQIGAENYNDPDDQMLILNNGRNCYGGACLRVSTPNHPVILDLEQDIQPPQGKFYFSLKDHMPELELDRYAYAEFNRIVLDPRLRKGEATRQMFQAVLERCLDYRVRYLFGIGDRVRTRLYRQIYRNMGLDASIRDDVDIPMREEYEGVKMYLLWADLKDCHMALGGLDPRFLLEPFEDFEFE